ncbi:MAG: dynamin family protein [Planctomycetota bacterium]
MKFQEMVRAGGFPQRGRTYSYSREDPKDILNRSIDITREFDFLVAVTGAFSSGKSTLMNLLLGQPELLPASVIPMTAVCTVIRYGSTPSIRVRYVPFPECFERAQACIGHPFKKPFSGEQDLAEALEQPEHFVGPVEARESLVRFASILRRHEELLDLSVSFQTRAPFMSGGGVLPSADGGYHYFSPVPTEEKDYLSQGGDPNRWVTREWLALIQDVSLWVPSPLLENDIAFLDLPGLNCREDYHRQAIREYCNMADCILVTAFQPGNQADTEVITDFKKLSSNYREKLFFVFNKVDQFANEPEELVRAVDYLARDTIGADFPRQRFFLTSAHLAKSRDSGDESWTQELRRLRSSLGGVTGALEGLDLWVSRVSNPDDPGGVGHLKECLCSFLVEDAYPTKVSEVVRNYRLVSEALRDAASPVFEESIHMDPAEILRKTAAEYYRHVEAIGRDAVNRFRYDYLRGPEDHGLSALRQDLDRIFEHVHLEAGRRILAYFDRRILSSPLLEDPVSDFDLLTVADEASSNLHRELRDLVIESIHERICKAFIDCLSGCEFEKHLENIFRGKPECLTRVEEILARFKTTMLHSQKCIVRTRFHYMPRGRALKRLERSVPLARMKELLVETFVDFYPSWLYENLYSEVVERLWLSLFLDCEDLEEELTQFFRTNEGILNRAEVLERIKIPARFTDGSHDMYRSIRLCRQIDELMHEREDLNLRATNIGVIV